MFVRELPPLRHSHQITTPSGKTFRWGTDEPDPANIPSGVRHSDVMPGGYETVDGTLPRRSEIDYDDLERLSTWTIRDAAGEVVGEYRLERAPRTSGSQMAVSPSGVGWQAALEDDKSVTMIPVDIDLSNWGPPSVQRRIDRNATFGVTDPSTQPDETTGEPALHTAVSGAWSAAPGLPLCEAWYDAGPGVDIFALFYAWKKGVNVDDTNVNWSWKTALADDDVATTSDSSAELRAAGPGFASLIAAGIPRRHALISFGHTVAGGADGVEYAIDWTGMGVYGNHGLQTYGAPSFTQPPGVLASDVVARAVERWTPLSFTKGPNGSVKPSSFVVPHLVFRDPTTVGEIVRQASRFELPFWGVWENKEFFFDTTRTPRKRWRARVAPAQLQETGPQVDRLWESVIVQYQDVDGTTRTVGPPGSGADTETADLKDSDPENPANELGIVRRDLLQMGTGTVASATQTGRIFLEQAKLLDSSGQATLNGYVTDDHGVKFPFSAPRAGDEISFVDAADPSYRRIVRTEKDHSARTCSLDLDSPPEGLQALLERLSVSLVRLGL